MLLDATESSRSWLMNTRNLKTVSALQMMSVASRLCLGNSAVLIKVTKHEVLIMKSKKKYIIL